jgi:N-acetylmuramic acid 6-phosphate etherase
MVDMQLSNSKLVDRGTKMIVARFDLSYDEAKSLLIKHGSVRGVILHFQEG